MFEKTVEAPTLGFLLKKIKTKQTNKKTEARQISNGSKRSKVGSDWEKGMHKTVWNSLYLCDFILNTHSL